MAKRLLAAMLTLMMVFTAIPALAEVDTATLTNLATGATVTTNGDLKDYPLTNMNDGNGNSFWVGGSTATDENPNTVLVKLANKSTVSKIEVALPSGWGNRNQTIRLLTSVDGWNYTEQTAKTEYAFVNKINKVTLLELDTPITASYVKLEFSKNTGATQGQIGELYIWGTATEAPTPDPNLLAGATATANGYSYSYTADKAIDGDTGTWWSSGTAATETTPNYLTAQLAYESDIYKIEVALPPAANWGTRTQAIRLLTSVDGWSYTEQVAKTDYTFDNSTNGNKVTVLDSETPIKAAFVKLEFYTNTVESNKGQVGELAVWGVASDKTPVAVTNLAPTATVTTDGWGSSGTVDKINNEKTGDYWVGGVKPSQAAPNYAVAKLATESQIYKVEVALPGNWGARTQTMRVLTSDDGWNYTEQAAAADYAFNNSVNGNKVAVLNLETAAKASFVKVEFYKNVEGTKEIEGQIGELYIWGVASDVPVTGGNLAYGKTATSSGNYSTNAAANAVDSRNTTYWEGNGAGAYITVDLEESYLIEHVKLSVNPTWADDRDQTLEILVSDDGESFTTAVAATSYSFVNANGNVVAIDMPADVVGRYIRLIGTANNKANGHPQIAELEVYGKTAPPAPAKTMKISFVDEFGELYATEVASADELAALLTETKAPAIGGYTFCGWSESIDNAEILFDTYVGKEEVCEINAVYSTEDNAGERTKYAVTIGNDIALKTEESVDSTYFFDERIELTLADGVEGSVAYWLLDGQKLGYGKNSFTFYVTGENQVSVVMAEEGATYTPEASVAIQQKAYSSVSLDGNFSYTLSVIAQTYVPVGTATEFGVYYVGHSEDVDTIKQGGTAPCVKVVSSKSGNNQQYMTHLVKVLPNRTRYAIAYMVVDGQTIFSNNTVCFNTAADGTATMQ